MTYDIEIQIEELRAELRNACDAGERRQIQAELDIAQADLAAIVARQIITADWEPPRPPARNVPRPHIQERSQVAQIHRSQIQIKRSKR